MTVTIYRYCHHVKAMSKPAFLAGTGVQTPSSAKARGGGLTEESILPPSIASDSDRLTNWSNVLVLSNDCTQGVVVT